MQNLTELFYARVHAAKRLGLAQDAAELLRRRALLLCRTPRLRSGHISAAFFTPSVSARDTRQARMFSSVQSATPSSAGRAW